jgi:Holliday junction resolvasome RuvABC endonuclease subunit
VGQQEQLDQPALPARVLGVDPSFKRTGLAIAKFPTDPWVPGTETVTVGAVTAVHRPGADDDALRVDLMAKAALQWAQDHEVELVAIERPWFGKNYRTSEKLTVLAATIADRCRQAGYPVVMVYPAESSSAMGVPTGIKREVRKRLMRRAAQTRYGLVLQTDDEADAVGVAVAGYIHVRTERRELEVARLRAAAEAQRPRLPGMEKYKPRKPRKPRKRSRSKKGAPR